MSPVNARGAPHKRGTRGLVEKKGDFTEVIFGEGGGGDPCGSPAKDTS